MFNKEKKMAKKAEKIKKDLTDQRNDRCLPAARKVMQIIAKGRIEDKEPSEMFEDYSSLVRDVMDILMEHDVRLGDMEYVFRLALMPHEILKAATHQTIDKHLETVEKKLWGKQVVDVTINDLDGHLTEGSSWTAETKIKE